MSPNINAGTPSVAQIGEEDVHECTTGQIYATLMISLDGRVYGVEAKYDATRDVPWVKSLMGRLPVAVERAARSRIKDLYHEVQALQIGGGS